MKINKKNNLSLLTNLVSLFFVLLSFCLPLAYRIPILNFGLFALSGAITNWLAIYMLFEKIPGIYGSGVIPARFREFKQSIHDLIMNEFFTQENVQKFFDSAQEKMIDFNGIIDNADFKPISEAFVDGIIETKIGKILEKWGAQIILESFEEQFETKLKNWLKSLFQKHSVQKVIQNSLQSNLPSDSDVLEKIEKIIQTRLELLTAQMVKEIIQRIIKEHLEWLVVWGGILGGIIGLFTSLLHWL